MRVINWLKYAPYEKHQPIQREYHAREKRYEEILSDKSISKWSIFAIDEVRVRSLFPAAN